MSLFDSIELPAPLKPQDKWDAARVVREITFNDRRRARRELYGIGTTPVERPSDVPEALPVKPLVTGNATLLADQVDDF